MFPDLLGNSVFKEVSEAAPPDVFYTLGNPTVSRNLTGEVDE
jgi:hypothetical protein